MLDSIFRFDAATQTWQVHRPGVTVPGLNTLLTVRPRDVLFVRLPAGTSGAWAWPNLLPAGPVTVELWPGFTFLGFTGAETALDDLFAGLGAGVSAAFRFDAAAQRYDTYRRGRGAFLSSFTSVDPFQGLFVVNQGAATTVSWEQ